MDATEFQETQFQEWQEGAGQKQQLHMHRYLWMPVVDVGQTSSFILGYFVKAYVNNPYP